MLVKMAADEKPTEQVPQADRRHGAGGERNRPLLPDSHAEEEEAAKGAASEEVLSANEATSSSPNRMEIPISIKYGWWFLDFSKNV